MKGLFTLSRGEKRIEDSPHKFLYEYNFTLSEIIKVRNEGKILVNYENGQIVMWVTSHTTVKMLKQQLELEHSIPINQQQIIRQSFELGDDCVLLDEGIQSDTSVCLVRNEVPITSYKIPETFLAQSEQQVLMSFTDPTKIIASSKRKSQISEAPYDLIEIIAVLSENPIVPIARVKLGKTERIEALKRKIQEKHKGYLVQFQSLRCANEELEDENWVI